MNIKVSQTNIHTRVIAKLSIQLVWLQRIQPLFRMLNLTHLYNYLKPNGLKDLELATCTALISSIDFLFLEFDAPQTEGIEGGNVFLS